jgi:acyl carrier protein
MALPEPVLTYLNDNARRAGVAPPQEDDDLFRAGVLDSFALVEFLTLLEEHAGIKVPDADVNPSNFQTIAVIERYAGRRQGADG